MISARELALYVVVASFLAFFLSCGVSDGPSRFWSSVKEGAKRFDLVEQATKKRLPDFTQYEPLRILSRSEFPLDDPTRRVIIVGDIHGMIHPFNKLLATVDYDPDADVLIHTGDIISKAPHRDSMAVLSFMARNNITGVRGNHDQMVIEWKGWMKWICSSFDGCQWLQRVERDWDRRHKEDKSLALEDFLESEEQALGLKDKRWWSLIPSEWKMLGDHYRIARSMSDEEYSYLLNLPLRLYIPSAHAYVVHAGLLPSDPQYPFDSKRQPLAHLPKVGGRSKSEERNGVEHMRNLQEMAVLTKVPQNTNPWVVLNMRAVKNGKISRKRNGKDWYKIWGREMDHCIGFSSKLFDDYSSLIQPTSGKKKHGLPCYPISVFYGHTASVGLNVQRWSFGLDSGCVYGRRLSAFVIGGPGVLLDDVSETDAGVVDADGGNDDDTDASGKKKHHKNGDIVPFGDRYQGQVISVKC